MGIEKINKLEYILFWKQLNLRIRYIARRNTLRLNLIEFDLMKRYEMNTYFKLNSSNLVIVLWVIKVKWTI